MTLRFDGFVPAFPISPLVLVGVCAAGKSTLARNLHERGIDAKTVAQEHSRVQELYRRSGSLVIVLVAGWATVHRRRQLAWNPDFYRAEWERLRGARQDAALILHTDWLSAAQVADRAAEWFDGYFGFDRLWQCESPLSVSEQASIRAQFRG